MANEPGENKAPEAKLDTSKNIGWTGESFIADGRASKDSDGNITSWRFDFGDGTPPVEVTREEDAANVNHTYLRGGEYTITLTVFDNGKEQTGQKSDQDTKTVAINQRYRVAQGALSSTPIENSQVRSNSSSPFDVGEDADRFETTIEVTNTLASGSSQVEIKVVDSQGDTLDEETVTVTGGGQRQTVELEGAIKDRGIHHLEMKAKSGAVVASGEIEVYYDAGYTQ